MGKPAKTSKRVKETAQKPITEFFSEAKTSVLSIKSKQSSGTKDTEAKRSDDNATTSTNYNLNPLPSVHNEYTKTASKYNVNKTPAIEKAKRELMRKVFEESPDQRNTAPMYRTTDPSEGKENIPLQSTPIQPDSKRNKDFTHKTPIFNHYKLKDQEDDIGLILNNNAENRCEDLSFIVDDILSRNCEENVNPNNNENTVASDVSFTEIYPQASDGKIDSSRKLERSTACSLKTNPFLDNTLEDSFDRICL